MTKMSVMVIFTLILAFWAAFDTTNYVIFKFYLLLLIKIYYLTIYYFYYLILINIGGKKRN